MMLLLLMMMMDVAEAAVARHTSLALATLKLHGWDPGRGWTL